MVEEVRTDLMGSREWVPRRFLSDLCEGRASGEEDFTIRGGFGRCYPSWQVAQAYRESKTYQMKRIAKI